jgi:hypothetical protein
MAVVIQLLRSRAKLEVRRCRWHGADAELVGVFNLLLGTDPVDPVLRDAQRFAPDQDWLRALRAVALFEAHVVSGHRVPPPPVGADE